MKASELVERLRGPTGAMFDAADRKEAADFIEAQAKAIEELRDALTSLLVTNPKNVFTYSFHAMKAREALASHSQEGERG